MIQENKKIKSKLFFIVFGSYPFGGALHNRILSLAKGLKILNVSVKVLCVIPFSQNDAKKNNIKFNDIYDGIEYEYAYKKVSLPGGNIAKGLNLLKGFRCTSKILKKESSKGDVLFLFPTKYIRYSIAFYFVAKFLGLIYSKEINEFPFIHRSPVWLYSFFHKFAFKGFDIVFAMTTPLMDYYKKKVSKKAKLVHLPMTVDVSRFDNLHKTNSIDKKIVYCGDPASEND